MMLRRIALTASIIMAGCMPPYTTSLTPNASRSCPARGTASDRDPITWLFPTESKDNGQSEAWCKAVGPPVIDSLPVASFGNLAEDDSITIAVWNTDVGAGHLLAFLETELGLDCAIAPTLAPGSAHFVLLVQEALRRSNDIPDLPPQWAIPPPAKEEAHPGRRLDIVEVARHCGLSLMYVAGARNGHEARDGRREDKGEAILSTLPLSDFIAIELPYEAARRVAVAATVHNQRGDSLRVVSVHLISTPPPWRVLQTGNSSRLRQSLAVVDALKRVELDRADDAEFRRLHECYPRCDGDGLPRHTISTIVAGDLNTWSTRETALQHLLEHFPDSPTLLSEPTRGPFPTDHLLFRGNAARGETPDRVIETSYRRIDDTYYSDHNPIVAWFRYGVSKEALPRID
jgi:endonuclease/exonuclease/phosphatase family metal-dependent hydrolase